MKKIKLYEEITEWENGNKIKVYHPETKEEANKIVEKILAKGNALSSKFIDRKEMEKNKE